MWITAVEEGPYVLKYVPDRFKTLELCSRAVERIPWTFESRPRTCVAELLTINPGHSSIYRIISRLRPCVGFCNATIQDLMLLKKHKIKRWTRMWCNNTVMTVNAYLTSMIDASVGGDLWWKVATQNLVPKCCAGTAITSISRIMEAVAYVMI